MARDSHISEGRHAPARSLSLILHSFSRYILKLRNTHLLREIMAGISLETLPNEVLLEIGKHLDKPSTLVSSMTLNSRFYALITLHQEFFVTAALNSFVTPELLPQAIAVFAASKVESWTPERTTQIISQFKGAKYINRVRLSLKNGLDIQRRHEKILFVMANFVNLALPQHPKVLIEPKPLSKSEELRVLRAFYRFELCANIFRQHILDENPTCERCEGCKELTRSSVTHVILFHFSATDLEQLVIVTEFIQEANNRYGEKWEWDLTPAWIAPMSSKAWANRIVSFVSYGSFLLYRKTYLFMTDNLIVLYSDSKGE